jgi:hypothetical protein
MGSTIIKRNLTYIVSWANATSAPPFKQIAAHQAAALRHGAEEIIVIATVTGTFEGSPLQFQYHFTVIGNKIAGLSIRI